MPKTKQPLQRGLQPRMTGACPNPQCCSRGRVFTNLAKHLCQKHDCAAFMQTLRKDVFSRPATAFDVSSHRPPDQAAADEPMDDGFPIHDDTSHADTTTFPATSDFEQDNFKQYIGPNDADLFVNPHQAVFTTSRRVEVTLLKILQELEAPLWAFKVIMDWAFDAHQSGYHFQPQQVHYQSQLESISQWVGMSHMQPEVVEVALPGVRPDDKVQVTKFNFLGQLHSLLADKELNTPSNLVINEADPFSRYIAPDGLLGECLSGSWYNNAWDHMEQHTQCDYMIPIILYIDKTQMSLSGKLSIFPVQMSLSIFTEKTRRNSRAWRTLGFIANEDYYFTPAEQKANPADVKNARFHTQLHEILKSFYQAQEPNALTDIPIQLGDTCKRVQLYVPLHFIIGDVEGGDQLCSRQRYRAEACQRLCRTCDVSTLNAGRTDLVCNRVCVADVQHLVHTGTTAQLNTFRQYGGFNSLYNIDCGGDPYGVFSMIHTEGLHALEVGLIPYMLEILMEELTPTAKGELDGLVKRLLHHPKQHGYDPFPRLLWQDGVTHLKNLTGDLKVGKMFAIVAVALTREGQAFFTNNLKGAEVTWKKMLYVFQQMLCYWTWLKQDNFWKCNDTDARDTALKSIKIMMAQLQTLWPRTKGLLWNLTKLHEQFHVPMDIHRNGSHKNVHSGPQEHNHIPLKKAAKHTQLNKKKLDIQTGHRVVERLIIQRAYDMVSTEVANMSGVLPQLSAVQRASKGTYRFISDNSTGAGHVTASFHWKRTKHDGLVPLHQDHIIRTILTTLFTAYATPSTALIGATMLEIPFFTEYSRNDFIYRAHPNYRGDGPYYDWARVNWYIGDDPETGEEIHKSVIARILAFIQHPDGEIHAIVHSVRDTNTVAHGVFGDFWHLEVESTATTHLPTLQIVHVDCLLEHVCMIPYTSTNERMWVQLWHPSEWPGCFQTINQQ
jgi:Plavaka transposase